MADQQYVIDISANLTGTESLDQLDRLTEALTGAGKKGDAFQAAMRAVSGQLDAAKTSAAAANAALAEGQAHYSQLEREALRAAKALEKAAVKGAVPDGVAANAKAADAALAAYTGKLRGLEAASASATAEQAKYEKQLRNVEKVAGHVDARNAEAIKRYSKLAEASAVLPGPLGRYIGVAARSAKANEELTATFGKARATQLLFAAGAVIAATALVVLTLAVVAGTAAFAAYGIATADSARSAALSREAFAALSAETSAAVSSFDDVADATGLGDKELIALAKSLKSAKVAAADMPRALMAAATAEAALGAGGAGDFITRLQAGELAVSDFANEVEGKFGGVVAKKLAGLDAQGKRFGKNWRAIFSDNINLDPILEGVSILVGMFDKANPLAQAFGLGVEKVFGFISDNAVDAAYAIERFAIVAAISVLKVYLFFKENGDKIVAGLEALGIAAGLFSVAWAVANAGVIAGWVASAGAAVAAAASIAAAWLVAAAPALVFIAAIAAVGAAIYQLIYYWDDVVEGVQLIWADLTKWFQGLDMAQIGIDLIMGIVNGITSVHTAVIDAVTGAVGGAIQAAKDVLGIASPSKVFAEMGEQTAQGYSDGVESGTPQAQGSMTSLVSPSAAESASTSASSSGGRGRVDLAGATFNFYGVTGAEGAIEQLREAFTQILEGDADSISGARVPA